MRFIRFLLPLLALCLIAGAKKPRVTVRFHVEVNEVSGAPFIMPAIVPGTQRKITLSKAAEISENDITAIFPFPADDGSVGCAFKLDAHGKIALDTISTEARGAMILGFINGRAVTAMMIDRRVADGVITISRGITADEAALLAKAFPILGQKRGKAGRQAAAPAANSAANPAPAAASQAAPSIPPSALPQSGD